METIFPHIKTEPNKEKPKRQTYRQGWFLYRNAMISHHLQGAAICSMILWGSYPVAWVATLWFFGYVGYQFGCYYRKRDSVGLDLLDAMVGMIFILVSYLLILGIKLVW